MTLSRCRKPEGYQVRSALAISDRDGGPLAPLVVSLGAADGVHCSRSTQVREALSPLDELDPTMSYLEQLQFSRPMVHIIDAQADSVAHWRQWCSCPDRWLLIRADDRLVEWEGHEQKCSAIQAQLRDSDRFQFSREVLYHGKRGHQYVAEVPVRLLRAGRCYESGSSRRPYLPGPPLALRLIISEVRSLGGERLATWYLLAHTPQEVDAQTIALWYYWRWKIEEFFKLLKSAGLQAEQWQQESAAAIARRLLVAAMACCVVWRLARSEHAHAPAARKLLVRLSGRQLRRGREFTMPAMLAGLWNLLAIMEEVNRTPLNELQSLAQLILAKPP